MVNQFPNVFIAGAARSGTAAMCSFLKQHPDIHLSIIKEPHYFADDLMVQPHTVTDRNDYLSLFSDKPFNAEGSVWYLISERAAANIYQQRSDAKVIILLRRPWQQIQSTHGLYLRTGNEDVEDLAQAIEMCQSRLEGKQIPQSSYFHPGLQYLHNASYYQHIKRFKDVFGSQLKVIAFDDFLADNHKIMNQVFEFIGAESCEEIEFNGEAATMKLRAQAWRQLKGLPSHLRAKLHPNQIKAHQSVEDAVMSIELERHLKAYFKADVEKTSQLIGQDFTTLWYQD